MYLATWVWLIAASSVIAKHFQPRCVRLAGQQLGRALVHTLRMFAAQKAAMVEEELQQFQVACADFSTQEKITAQPAVEVLDDRTDTHNLLTQGSHRLLEPVETATQLFA